MNLTVTGSHDFNQTAIEPWERNLGAGELARRSHDCPPRHKEAVRSSIKNGDFGSLSY